MVMDCFYRGGASLKPRPIDVKLDVQTQRLRPTRGVSVDSRPDHPMLAKLGGAYRLGPIPEGLHVVQLGRDPAHHEILPSREMRLGEYETLLGQISLYPVTQEPLGGEHHDNP